MSQPDRRLKLPAQVLERARTAAGAAKKPAPPPQPARARRALAREKVVAALKKLHPMD